MLPLQAEMSHECATSAASLAAGLGGDLHPGFRAMGVGEFDEGAGKSQCRPESAWLGSALRIRPAHADAAPDAAAGALLRSLPGAAETGTWCAGVGLMVPEAGI